jgi:hypothetical protein
MEILHSFAEQVLALFTLTADRINLRTEFDDFTNHWCLTLDHTIAPASEIENQVGLFDVSHVSSGAFSSYSMQTCGRETIGRLYFMNFIGSYHGCKMELVSAE